MLFSYQITSQTDSIISSNFVNFFSLLLIAFNTIIRGFPGGSEIKASACNAGDLGLIPGTGRSPGEGNGNPLQHPYLENAMDRGV